MASVEKNSNPRKRGRPKTKPTVDAKPQRKSARVEKKLQENNGKSKRINDYNDEDWCLEDDDEDVETKYGGMFKKVTDNINSKMIVINDEDEEDEVSDDEDDEDDDDDDDDDVESDELFQDEDKDIYDFDQQSSIISSLQHNGADRKWVLNRQSKTRASNKTEIVRDNQNSWGSNIYSYLATVLNSRADLDLYSTFLKSNIVNRSLDLTISDLCKPIKTANCEGASATLQNFMQKINDNDAIVGLMKHVMSDNYKNSAHRLSHFVFVVKQPINGLRFYPKFDEMFKQLDNKIVSESAFVIEADKTEVKKNAPVIDTLVVTDSFYDYITDKLLLENCANLQRLLVGLDENRHLFGIFVVESWNRAGIPYNKINNHKTELFQNNSVNDQLNVELDAAGTNPEVKTVNNPHIINTNSSPNYELCDAFIVRIGNKNEALHLIARVESKFIVFNIVSEVNFAFKKHALSPTTSINLEGMHSSYSEVLGEEKSIIVISDQLYKSFIKALNKEIQIPAGKFKKNVLLDKVTRHPIGVFFDTEVVMDMIIQESSSDQKSVKRSLTLASLNGILVGFEISIMKCITKCYQLISDTSLNDECRISSIQTTSLTSTGSPITLQFCNIETHENTVVSAYLYDNLSYSKRLTQIEDFIYQICERIYEMPFQLSLFDSVFRMYQFSVKISRTHEEFASPVSLHCCIFCSREFKMPAIAFDHSIRHLGLIKFKCQKHQMVFNDFKSYKNHRDEFIDCDDSGENETEMETQKLLNISTSPVVCSRCEKCLDYFPVSDMLSQHQDVCDGMSFSTRTPLESKVASTLLDESGSLDLLVCGLCGLNYPKLDVMCNHMSSHLSCSVCKIRMTSIDEVSVHLRDHTLKNDIVSGQGRKKVFVCDICNDFYGNKNNYYYHQWNEHGVVHPPIKNEDVQDVPMRRRSKRMDELSYIATGMKKFNCKFCGAEVKVSGRDYVKHLDLKHGLTVEMDCLCRICADIFETPEKLSDHLRVNHIQGGKYINAGIQSIFSCDKCTFFGHFRGVLTHSKTIHCDPNPCLYECPKCPERMADRRLWRLHLEKHEENQNYSCNECQTLFKTDYALKLHQTSFHGAELDELKCKLCGEMMTSVEELQNHVLSSHTDIESTCPFACLSCPERFVNEAELNEHTMNSHMSLLQGGGSSSGVMGHANATGTNTCLPTTSNTTYSCDICHKQCKTERAHELHRMKHFRTRIFQCTECQATFRSKLAMRRHIRVDHLNLEPERYECQICGKIVTQISMHMLIHKSARYQCEYCGKRFTKSAYYNEHVRIHRNEKPYECHICGRRFNKKSNLNVHIGFHEKHRDDYGNYLEIKPRGRGHPSYDPRKTQARKLAQRKFDVQCGSDIPGGCIHDDLEYKWALVAVNSKMCSTSDS